MSVVARHLFAPFRAIEQFLLEPIDARVYALVRICYAITTLAIVLDLWPARIELFADTGMLGRVHPVPWFHPLRWIHSETGVTLLVLGMGLASICLALGLFTRLCTALLVAWGISYSNTAYPAESGYDAVARVVGAALLLAPPIRSWALDRFLFGPGQAKVSRHALRLMQWQLVILYLATVWLKAPDRFWRNGELMAYFMASMYSRFPSPAWAQYGRLSTLFTWGTVAVEVAVPFLLWSRRTRPFALLLGVSLHGTIALTSTVGLFSLAMLPLYAAFLEEDDLRLLRLVR